MAKGDVNFRLSDMHINRMGAQVEVRGNATKLIEDEDGSLQSLGSWVGVVAYPVAGFGARTMSSINADVITEIKSKNAAIASKVIG